MYLCKRCIKYFSVPTDYSLDKEAILLDHLDGISIRKLAVKYNISKSVCQRICFTELQKLPNNNDVTVQNSSRFGPVLMPDAKYINVKGYKYKFAFLWAVDYFNHDFPFISLANSESFAAWSKYFSQFKQLGSSSYNILVCDDNTALKLAAVSNFPLTRIQTCYNHLKENYRRVLKVRSQSKYRHFMGLIEIILCSEEIELEEFARRLKHAAELYSTDPLALSVILDIRKRAREIHAYRMLKDSPKTTNLIESFNSQLESRLFSLKTSKVMSTQDYGLTAMY